MPKTNADIEQLIIKHLQQTLTKEDQIELDNWLKASDENRQLFKKLTDRQFISTELDKLYSYDEEKGWENINRSFSFSKEIHLPGQLSWWNSPWSKVAAAVFIVLAGIGYYFFTLNKDEPGNGKIVKTTKLIKDDVMPGGNRATLTLADGSTIVLDNAQNGALAQQGNTKVIKLGSKLAYTDAEGTKTIVYNTLTTPRGGQYQVELPDGSLVWLNAASSLHFPTAFIGKERRVEIIGEAYFEIAKNTAMPFIVSANGAEVQVLGTHFNLMAYGDEDALKTTLLEGSIKFIKGNLANTLKPQQQLSLLKSGRIKVANDINVDEVVAWKNGLFNFQGTEIETVMRQLSRWYGIEVKYQKSIDDLFYAKIPRATKLSEVLRLLELTGKVHFEIDGRSVIVKP